ncbi:MAG: DnaA regulatory inactivator Hda [Spongiibacteraceae bacterium]|nr:DnaA regulatory inactivator Hda [Spongiibacteraceae bacterium]
MRFPIEQLPLAVQLRDGATFDNFYQADNSLLVDQLRCQLKEGERYIYLFGNQGSGRSHLLQAACSQANEMQLTSVYLPLEQLQQYSPQELFEGLEQLSLVCLDDLQYIVGNADWEQQLFHLFNRLAQSGTRLLIAADSAVRELAVSLADLSSRLSWGSVYQLKMLNDEQRILALQFRAAHRGMEMNNEVAQFIVNRSQRDTGSLLAVLDLLDNASLKEQRRLTVPFVKSVLDW